MIAFLDELGGRLSQHFDLDRFGAEAERWAAQGLTTKQIAQLLAEQCRACAPPKRSPSSGYFTVEAYRPEGGLFRAVEHVLGSEVAATKRRINRDARQRLVYALISEGNTPRHPTRPFRQASLKRRKKVLRKLGRVPMTQETGKTRNHGHH